MGYDTTLLLPLVALSIFKHYEKPLLEIETDDEYNDIFESLLDINVLDLINSYLFNN